MTRVFVHIDRLVLRGVHPADRAAVAAALQGELARGLARPGAAERLSAAGDRTRLAAGAQVPGGGATPGEIGRAAGRTMTKELGARQVGA